MSPRHRIEESVYTYTRRHRALACGCSRSRSPRALASQAPTSAALGRSFGFLERHAAIKCVIGRGQSGESCGRRPSSITQRIKRSGCWSSCSAWDTGSRYGSRHVSSSLSTIPSE
ncbi:hypothetical protein PsorP6_006893 [Peronosclerospora sorghi]|uniref:Uncharacterized protein n=1 Tax=Peronosclerospora sorghi TaxID=230839 RepID=A0ACC0W939_9STRA|nr:hypothetical protein PsorP6_006893 [Peronosclerospora sorghi]